MKIKTQEISTLLLKEKGVKLYVKRIDLCHEYISGNKWYKLKYNLIEAKKASYQTILTFGGAYSNHILATAVLAKKNGLNSIGIIRGEETLPLNPTLELANKNQMKLYYISRKEYLLKNNNDFISKMKKFFGDFYLIPEGGSNVLALKGTEEIIDSNDSQDYICCSVGTGTTIAGIINSSNSDQCIIGFPAIKGFNKSKILIKELTNKNNYSFINGYEYGGYAKISTLLVDFINSFYSIHNIPLDAVYTGKMMSGVISLISNNYFPFGSSILVIHTGGIQGNKGMKERFNISLPTV